MLHANVTLSDVHIVAGTPVLLAVLVLVGILSVVLVGAGIWLVYMGSSGTTDITVMGSTLKSRNVGVAGIFCGTVLAVFVFTRALEALERLAAI